MKLATCKRRCPAGELYKFKNGIAEVPGLYIGGKQATITIFEFARLIQELNKEEQTNVD